MGTREYPKKVDLVPKNRYCSLIKTLLQFFVRLLARSKISGFRVPGPGLGSRVPICVSGSELGPGLGSRVPTWVPGPHRGPGYQFRFRVPTCVLYQHILWDSLMFTIKFPDVTLQIYCKKTFSGDLGKESKRIRVSVWNKGE